MQCEQARGVRPHRLKSDVREVVDPGDSVLQVESPYSDEVDPEENGETGGVAERRGSSDELPATCEFSEDALRPEHEHHNQHQPRDDIIVGW